MAEFMGNAAEVAELDEFIFQVDDLDLPLDPDVERAQDAAETLRTQMEAPVRIAVAGKRGTGKSSLINLLAGAEVIPTDGSYRNLPPIVLRFAEHEQTTAGWWDRAGESFQGLNLDAALAKNPDVISFELNCDILRDLWLIDVPALEDASSGREARFALSRLADMMLWCSSACDAVSVAERDLWKSLPPQIRRFSLLVLTFADRVREENVPILQDRLKPQNLKQFRQAAPIALPAAWQAMISEDPKVQALWSGSGAEDLVEFIMQAVLDYRADQLAKVKRAIRMHIDPVRAKLGSSKPEAAPVQEAPTEIAPAAKLADPAIIYWLPKVKELIDSIDNGELEDNGTLVEESQRLVSEFLDELSAPGRLPPDAGWVMSEFEKADDLLTLLQFEDAEEVAADAARVIAQLSDALAAVSPAA